MRLSRDLLTRRWLLGHVAVTLLVAVFLALGMWQVQRARAGNVLSYGYSLQWPAFAVFTVFVWVRTIRDRARRSAGPGRAPVPDRRSTSLGAAPPVRAARPERSGAAWAEADDDPELAAYNRYLAWLAANPGRRPSEYPG